MQQYPQVISSQFLKQKHIEKNNQLTKLTSVDEIKIFTQMESDVATATEYLICEPIQQSNQTGKQQLFFKEGEYRKIEKPDGYTEGHSDHAYRGNICYDQSNLHLGFMRFTGSKLMQYNTANNTKSFDVTRLRALLKYYTVSNFQNNDNMDDNMDGNTITQHIRTIKDAINEYQNKCIPMTGKDEHRLINHNQTLIIQPKQQAKQQVKPQEKPCQIF